MLSYDYNLNSLYEREKISEYKSEGNNELLAISEKVCKETNVEEVELGVARNNLNMATNGASAAVEETPLLTANSEQYLNELKKFIDKNKREYLSKKGDSEIEAAFKACEKSDQKYEELKINTLVEKIAKYTHDFPDDVKKKILEIFNKMHIPEERYQLMQDAIAETQTVDVSSILVQVGSHGKPVDISASNCTILIGCNVHIKANMQDGEPFVRELKTWTEGKEGSIVEMSEGSIKLLVRFTSEKALKRFEEEYRKGITKEEMYKLLLKHKLIEQGSQINVTIKTGHGALLHISMEEFEKVKEETIDLVPFMVAAYDCENLEQLDSSLAAMFEKRITSTGLQSRYLIQPTKKNGDPGSSSKCLFPTLLHFAASYGLTKLYQILSPKPESNEALRKMDRYGRTPIAFLENQEHLEKPKINKEHFEKPTQVLKTAARPEFRTEALLEMVNVPTLLTQEQLFEVEIFQQSSTEIDSKLQMKATLTSPDGGETQFKTVKHDEGKNVVKIRCGSAGIWKFDVSVGDEPIRGSPLMITVEKQGLVNTIDTNGKPWDVVWSEDDCLLVAGLRNSIHRFKQSGEYISKVTLPSEVKVYKMYKMKNNEIVYTDYENKCITLCKSDGHVIKTIGKGILKNPCGFGVDKKLNVVYVADYDEHCVFMFNMDNNKMIISKKTTKRIGSEGHSEGNMYKPKDVTVTNEGHLIIADCYNNRLQLFDNKGKFMNILVGKGDQDGKVIGPYAVIVDKDNNILVTSEDKLQLFNSNGYFINRIDQEEDGLNNPYGLSIISYNPRRVAVANHGGRNIKIFNY